MAALQSNCLTEEYLRHIWGSFGSSLSDKSSEEDEGLPDWKEEIASMKSSCKMGSSSSLTSTPCVNTIRNVDAAIDRKDLDLTPAINCPSLPGHSSSSSSGSSSSSYDYPRSEDFSLFNFNHSLFTGSSSPPHLALTMMEEEDSGIGKDHHLLEIPLSQEQRLSLPPPRDVNMEINSLTASTKYEIVQRNGQRIYGGPPPNWSGPPPEKGAEIFVGKVPRDCFEDELVPLFSTVGKIYELRLMMDFSGSNRGYLFVKYTNSSEANLAIQRLNNYEIRPKKRIGVCRSVDNRKLWISGLPKDRPIAEIKADLEKKTPGVTDVLMYLCQKDKSKSRSYAFVEYENHRAAALARRKLVPGRIFILDHEIEKVDWAQPEVEVEDEVMNKVKNLFVRNLSPLTSEYKIGQLFEELSGDKLERVYKSKDYSFIHFHSRKAAETALSKAQNLHVDGCLLDVRWAKPVDKDIYNSRKELTKLFSSGSSTSSLSSGGGITDPFRGAPGTTPPRSLLKMLNAQASLRLKKDSVDQSESHSDLLHHLYGPEISPENSGSLLNRQYFKGNPFFDGYHGISQNNGLLPYTYGFTPLPPFMGGGRFSAPPPYSYALSSSQALDPISLSLDPISLSLYQMSLN